MIPITLPLENKIRKYFGKLIKKKHKIIGMFEHEKQCFVRVDNGRFLINLPIEHQDYYDILGKGE